MATLSVIIPTYNYAGYVKTAVDSVLSQHSLEHQLEIVVIDDGSTDNTKEVLQHYIDQGQVKYFFQQNKGKANATAFAISQCTGDYIFNLDADDYFLPGKLSKTLAIFESDSTVVHVASPAMVLEENSHTSTREDIPAAIVGKAVDGNWLMKYFYTANILFGGGTTFAARASVLRPIVIPDGIDMYIDEFLILAVLPFGKSYLIPEPLSVWRVHGNNYSVGRKSKENIAYKAKRLLDSSSQMMLFLEDKKYDSFILKTYRLKDLTGRIAFKESANNKGLADIFRYGYHVFFVVRPSWVQIKNYHVLNRLIPMRLFRILKGLKKRVTHT